jgi:hypothetical protein
VHINQPTETPLLLSYLSHSLHEWTCKYIRI